MGNMFKETGNFVPDSLIAGNEFPIMANGITVAGGQGALVRGTLVGLVEGKAYVTGSTVSGNKVGVTGILTDDIEESTEDVVTTAYVSGIFNPNTIIVDDSTTVAAHAEELRKLGIYLKEVQEY